MSQIIQAKASDRVFPQEKATWGRIIQWYAPNGDSIRAEGSGFRSQREAFKSTVIKAIRYGWKPPTLLERWRYKEDYWRWTTWEKRYAWHLLGYDGIPENSYNMPIPNHLIPL